MSNEKRALEGIKRSSGTEQGEYSINLFISHHLNELQQSYWEKHLGVSKPTNEQVIDLLTLCCKWEDVEIYDFTLPDDATNYVISVSLDDAGLIEDISMES